MHISTNLFVIGILGVVTIEAIWPHPSNISTDTSTDIHISLCSIQLFISPCNVDSTTTCMINGAFNRALALYQKVSNCVAAAPKTPSVVHLSISNPTKAKLNPATDPSYLESYQIQITALSQILISAATPIAALRSAWTLFQIPNPILHPITISDQPRFQYRSLLVDTTRSISETSTERHSIQRIYEIIDRMEIVKMNVLHWHLTDTDGISFPFSTMTPFQPYSLADLTRVTTYALQRGIAVLPEIPMIGHSGSVWAKQAKMSSFVAPGCPKQLNLDSVPAKKLVIDLFKSMCNQIFPQSPIIGFGNDEVAPCGNDYRRTFIALNNGINGIASEHGKSIHIWADTILDQNMSFNTSNTIVAPWKLSGSGKWATFPDQLNHLASLGYRIVNINSEHWYIGSQTDEQGLYNYDPVEGVNKANSGSVIGGSVALWEPSLEDLSGQYVLWPKSAAVAEILWSSKSWTGNGLDDRRFIAISEWIDAVETDYTNPTCN